MRQPGVPALAGQDLDLGRPGRGAVVEPDPGAQRGEVAGRDRAAHLDVIGLGHVAARGEQPGGQLAVVGEQEDALAVEVEAADRGDLDRQVAQVVHHRRAAAVVGDRGDAALGLVEQDVEVGLGVDALAVDRDPVGVGVDLGAELADDLAVDRDPARDDELLGLAPRRHPGLGQVALQPDLGHAADSASDAGRSSSAAASGSAGASDSAGSAAATGSAGSAAASGPAGSCAAAAPPRPSTTRRLSSVSSEYSRRVGRSRRSPRLKKSRNSRGRAVDERPARLLLLAQDADQVPVEQDVQRARRVDPADVVDLRPRDRLPVGDDRQGLELGARQPHRPPRDQLLHPGREPALGAEHVAAGHALQRDAAALVVGHQLVDRGLDPRGVLDPGQLAQPLQRHRLVRGEDQGLDQRLEPGAGRGPRPAGCRWPRPRPRRPPRPRPRRRPPRRPPRPRPRRPRAHRRGLGLRVVGDPGLAAQRVLRGLGQGLRPGARLSLLSHSAHEFPRVVPLVAHRCDVDQGPRRRPSGRYRYSSDPATASATRFAHVVGRPRDVDLVVALVLGQRDQPELGHLEQGQERDHRLVARLLGGDLDVLPDEAEHRRERERALGAPAGRSARRSSGSRTAGQS